MKKFCRLARQMIKTVTATMMEMNKPMKNRICFWCADGFLLRDMALFC
jgi:hypothetical protein